MRLIALAAVCAAMTGCATSPENISAAYVSPLQYDTYSCPQLREEATRVSMRASQAIGEQSDKATRDAVVTTVGAVVFWPALFFIKGDGASGAEVARLKGEMQAVEQASIKRNCGISFQRS